MRAGQRIDEREHVLALLAAGGHDPPGLDILHLHVDANVAPALEQTARRAPRPRPRDGPTCPLALWSDPSRPSSLKLA